MDITKDMDIPTGKTTMVSILMDDMDIPIRTMVIIILDPILYKIKDKR